MKNNPAFLVGTVTEFIDFIGRTHHSIQIIKEKERFAARAAALASVQSISVVTEYQEFTKLRKKP